MARLSDHDQRDAEHALRAEITLVLARYARRMADKGKAYITEAISKAAKEGENVDGTSIGRAAADRVKAEYFATSTPDPAIEAVATRVDSGPRPGTFIEVGNFESLDTFTADGGTRTDSR